MYQDRALTPICRTLVVEDDADGCEAVRRMLNRYGYKVDCARTVSEALRLLSHMTPDFVVLDLMLPDGDGLAVLRYIREQDLPVKVAVATGAADSPVTASAVLMKPDAVFMKPLDFTELLGWLSARANVLPGQSWTDAAGYSRP
jgi:DNA-binding response OmpR family regulator